MLKAHDSIHFSTQASTSRRRSRGPLSAILLAGSAGWCMLAATPVHAQQSANAGAEQGPQLETIVVTAQRRSENQQNVPIAITAVSDKALAEANITSTRDLGIVAPSFVYGDIGGWVSPSLRGVGTPATGPGIESPVASYVDGVYMAAMLGGTIDFNNVQGVEVINGPQGTLFGRNATGGLVQILTKDPTFETNGNLEVGYGNYNTVTGSAYVTTPVIADKVAADFSVNARYQHDGYGQNLMTGTQMDRNSFIAGRAKLLFKLNDDLTIKIAGDYAYADAPPSVQVIDGSLPLGGPNRTPPNSSNGPVDPMNKIRQGGVHGYINYDLGFATLHSITAYRELHVKHEDQGSLIANPTYTVDVALNEDHRQFSQELQLSSKPGAGLTWTLGAYYFNEVAKWDPATLGGGYYSVFSAPAAWGVPALLTQYYNIASKTESLSFYGQATKAIVENTNLTLGLRYTTELRKYHADAHAISAVAIPDYLGPGFDLNVGDDLGVLFGAVKDAQKRFNKLTWRAALDHHFSDALMGYVSYNRGFRSGAFDPITGTELKPETLDAYEAGFKSEFMNRRLRLNAAAYLYNYKNMQVVALVNGLPGVHNAANSRIYGIDIDAQAAVTSHLTINASAALMHAEFRKFDGAPISTPNPAGGSDITFGSVTGNRVPHAPRAVLNASATYSTELLNGQFSLTGAISHNSGWFAEADNRLHQPAYDIVNLSAKWESANGFGIKGWVSNLTNRHVWSFAATNPYADGAAFLAPRAYGVTLSKKF